MVAYPSTPRTAASRALLALLGLVLAIVGQHLVGGRTYVLDGVVLFAVGVGLFLSSVPRIGDGPNPLSPFAEGKGERGTPPLPLVGSRDEGAGSVATLALADALRLGGPFALGAAALVAALASLAIFAGGALPSLAWLFFVFSVAAAVLAFWVVDGPRPRLEIPHLTGHGVALLGICLIAAAFRFYRLDTLPAGLWWDEAFSGLHVRQILEDPSYRPVFVGGRGQGPTALWYTMAPFVLALGPTAAALRASVALAGTLGVLSTYLLGRELFGSRVGLVAAAVIATLAWHVNFSRIGFNAIWSATLDTLAVYLLIRALRTRRLLDFALGGATLGLAAHMYLTTRLVPFVLAAYLLHRFLVERGGLARRSLPGLVVATALCLLTISPLVQFASADPVEFNSRTSEASIFSEVAADGSLDPIVKNVREHVLMFNYAGDDNGRHNLPGRPMLDQVVGAAFVVGLALAIRAIRRPECFLLVAWVPVMLVGGIFSLSFESPQALRTIDETTAVALFAALPIVGIWERFASLPTGRVRVTLLGRPGPSLAATLVGLLLAVVAGLNYERYFVRQASDFAVWSAFSTAETAVAERVNALPPAYQVYLDESWLDHPTIEYLTSRPTEFRRFEAASSLPFRDAAGTAAFLRPEQEAAASYVSRLYPDAEVEVVQPEFGGPAVLLAAIVTSEDVSALHGAVASYFVGTSVGAQPAQAEPLTALDLDYSRSSPLAYPFSVEVRGTVLVPRYGSYTVSLEAPADGELLVDETPLLRGGERKEAMLARGVHTVRLRATLDGPSHVRVLWQSPGSPRLEILSEGLFAPTVPSTGLLGAYYPNASWAGQPALEQIDPELSIRFHILPLPRPYTVEWQGKLVAPMEGLYRFGAEASSDAWVYVDGHLVAENQGAPRQVREGEPFRLDRGLHDVRVRFLDSDNHSYIRVHWSPPGEERQVLPGEYLLPPRGAYPDLPTLVAEPSGPAPGWQGGDLPRAAFRLSATLGLDAGLQDPRGVAVDPDGYVYVADTGNARVVKLSPDGEVVTSWGTKGGGESEFQEPVDVEVEPAGGILVVDAGEGYLQRFSPEGDFLARFGGPGISPYHPRGIGVDYTGEISVADTGSSRITQVGEDGQLVGKLGQRGQGSGQLVEPTDVIRLPDGQFVVVDSANDRALLLDPDFRLTAEWPLPPGESVWGPHLALDDRGGVYVSDPDGKRVIRYSLGGEALEQVGDPGELGRPVGIATDSDGRLYVADAARGVIAVYEPVLSTE